MGQFYSVPNTAIKIYIPSWALNVAIFPKKLIVEQVENICAANQVLLTVVNGFTDNTPFEQKCENERLYAKFRLRFKLDKITKMLSLENDGITQIVLPRDKVSHYFKITHDQSGHFGESRVTDFLKNSWWPCKKADISNYVSSCSLCQQRKGCYM
jgi:hypothetical protein